MKVSVIVPLYNKAPFIQRTLDSIRAQTWSDFEVLVVNDGSTDGGDAVVRACPDPRIRLIDQANAGPGVARNRGVAQATGTFLAFLDADDEWLPSFLQRSLDLLDQYGPDVASVSSGYLHEPSGRSTEPMWRKRGLREGTYRLNPGFAARFVVALLAYLSPWNTVARADRVRRWGGFFHREKCVYGEDSYLWLKILLNETVAVHLEPLVRFHTEASALSANLGGPRPVEPVLRYPDDLHAVCPADLRPLLDNVLAVRALKTTCMLGYWGRWREGQALLKQFCPWSSWRLPLFATAHLAATPLGAVVGRVWRGVQSVPRRARDRSPATGCL